MKKLLIMIITLLLLFACSNSNNEKEDESKKFNVGILQLVEHEALDQATKGFQDALIKELGEAVSFDDQNASGDVANCAMISNQFVSEGVDLIFANATPALQAAVSATGDIPIVGTSVTSFKVALGMDNWDGVTGINVTGTSDLAPLDQQAAQVKEIVPSASKVAIFYCSSEPNSVFQADEIEKHFAALGLESQRFTFADSNDIASVANSACEYGDVVYIPTDNAAAAYASEDQFSKPVVAGEAGICKNAGAVTISISYYDIGFRAGEMAADILKNNNDPASMKVEEVSKVTKMFNPNICEKFNIEVSDDYVSLFD